MKNLNWTTLDEAVRSMREKADDIESVVLLASLGPFLIEKKSFKGPLGLIRFCGGTSRIISTLVLAELINDGLLNRLNIPFKIEVPE